MKVRIISAAVAVVAAIAVLIFADTWLFNLVVASIAAMALYEFFKATGLVRYRTECGVCFAYASADCFASMLHRNGVMEFFDVRFYGFLFVVAMLFLYLKHHDDYIYAVPFSMIGSTMVISYAFHTLTVMVEGFDGFGTFAVVLTLLGAWLADSGAYFTGTFFGKNKLCPDISPKKTIEGVIGGALCNGVLLLLASGVYGSFVNKDISMHYFVIFLAGILCSLAGLLGDLSMSVVKRQTGIKDFGKVMPGHGGALDRFDSVIIVAPFMYWLFIQGCIVAF